MQEQPDTNDSIPSDCFQQADLEIFQALEGRQLETVHYYLWRVHAQKSFLYALELCFDNREALLLTGGEDNDAIRRIEAASLAKTALNLQNIHNEAIIQRIIATVQPLWRDVAGTPLKEIRLSRHENRLYSNDALLLDFDAKQIMLQLSDGAGLILGEY